jgi:hypothetical protein
MQNAVYVCAMIYVVLYSPVALNGGKIESSFMQGSGT